MKQDQNSSEDIRKQRGLLRITDSPSIEAIITTDNNWKIVSWNDIAQNIFGYKEGDILGKNFSILLYNWNRNEFEKVIKELVSTLESDTVGKSIELNGLSQSGNIIPLLVSISIWNLKKKIFFTTVIRKITKSKENDKGISNQHVKRNFIQTEDKYQMMIERLNEGIILEDKEGYISFMNPRASVILGYDLDELKGKHWRITVPKENFDLVQSESNKRVNGVSSGYETSLLRKDGFLVPVSITANPLFTKEGVYEGTLSLITDITEKKKIKDELIQAKEKYQMLVERMEEGIFVEDAEGVITFVNPKYLEMSGYTEEELYGKHWSFVVAPKFLEKLKNETKQRPKGISSTYETGILRKDGKVLPIINTATPLFSIDGNYEGVLSVFTDVSKIKQTEAELIKAKERYQKLVERMEEGIFVEDAKGIVTFVNQKYMEMSGYTEEDLYGKHWSNFVPLDSQDNITSESEKRPKGISSTYETSILRKDGSVIPIKITASPLFTKNGEFDGVLSVMTDITEQKIIEKELREAKEMYQMLVEKMEEGVFWEDADGYYSFVNPKGASLLGYTQEELLGKHYTIVIAPEEREKVKTETAKRPKGVYSTYESQFVRKDGSTVPIMITANPLYSKTGEFNGVLAVCTDITKQKEIEKELIKAKEKYQMLIEQMEEVVLLEDTEGIITFINPKISKILGYNEEELLGKHWSYIIDPEHVANVESETYKRPKGISSTYESVMVTKDGIKVPIIVTASPIFSIDNEFEGVLSVFTEITELKKTEEALRESKEKNQMLIENMQEGVLLTDSEGNIEFINPRLSEMIGLTNEELAGNPVTFLISREEGGKVEEERVEKLVSTRGRYETILLHKDGTTTPVIISSNPIYNETGGYQGVLAVVTDISEQKTYQRLQDRFIASTSHELRTPLTIIKGYIDFLKKISKVNRSTESKNSFKGIVEYYSIRKAYW